MTVFKCKMCGGSLEIQSESTVAVCEYCGTKQTLPKLHNEKRVNLYDRANHFRRNDEFDKAIGIYEQILNDDDTDAEAYWSLVLCRYGIEYVEDPETHKQIPTVNRAQFTSVFDDDNYQSALKYADKQQKAIYEQEATTINEIQKGILSISQKEEPFDIFICYKETDKNGRRTPDSVLANELYHLLVQEGYKVFYSRITLEDKLGIAYEPYIFAALHSSKVMVVLGTKAEYFNAAWVKNEWSRYLALIKNKEEKVLIPAFRDMDPYDLPEEFSHLQAQDMSKLGFMQDLIRGIKKIINTDKPKEAAPPHKTVVIEGNVNIEALLKRVYLFLEDGDWQDADEYCEKILDNEPECAQAYVGKLMAALRVRKQEKLADQKKPFDDHDDYIKAIRFGDDALKEELKGYISHIKNRNEKLHIEGLYAEAVDKMNSADSEEAFKNTALLFESILGYQDAEVLREQCIEEAEACQKDEAYKKARDFQKSSEIDDLEKAISIYEKISGWKDADKRAAKCHEKIKDIIYEQAQKLHRSSKISEVEEAIHLYEKIRGWKDADEKIKVCYQRIEKIKALKKRAIKICIGAVIAVIAVAFASRLIDLFIMLPNKYDEAMNFYNNGSYVEAYERFKNLGYRDSAEKAKESLYQSAMEDFNAGRYIEAYKKFNKIDYKDSNEKAIEALYNDAMEYYNVQDYLRAYFGFNKVNAKAEYKDSKEKSIDSLYNRGVQLLNNGDYSNAYEIFGSVNYRGTYKDSIEKADESLLLLQKGRFDNIDVGSIIKFGAYEQDNVSANGKEEIEWRVLAIEDNKALIISDKALDCQPYHETKTDITWENCTLRAWLNEEFYNEAFSSQHQALITTTVISADNHPKYDTNPGNDTEDKVFLLSIEEANKYFDNDKARILEPTPYAKTQGVGIYVNGTVSWWLRTPDRNQQWVAIVGAKGWISSFIVNDDDTAVRPALWIDLDK